MIREGNLGSRTLTLSLAVEVQDEETGHVGLDALRRE